MIEGTKIKLGEKEYIVPALSFGQLKRLAPDLAKLAEFKLKDAEMPGSDTLGAVVNLIHTAIKRNYPEATVEDVEDGLDMRNMKEVVLAIMGQSGLTQQPGEAQAGS